MSAAGFIPILPAFTLVGFLFQDPIQETLLLLVVLSPSSPLVQEFLNLSLIFIVSMVGRGSVRGIVECPSV